LFVSTHRFALGPPPPPHAAVDADADTFADRFPAASAASTAKPYDVPHVSPDTVYDVEAVEPFSVPPT
jgi:hypothetical protein